MTRKTPADFVIITDFAVELPDLSRIEALAVAAAAKRIHRDAGAELDGTVLAVTKPLSRPSLAHLNGMVRGLEVARQIAALEEDDD